MTAFYKLTPARTLDHRPEWMTDPDIERIFYALNANADKTVTALFVGGCVRNALLRQPGEDIDIATLLSPDEVTKALESKDISVIPTGVEHGTVTAVLNNKSVEITTLRKDVETDGRRATISFTKDWRQDAQRRDFTFNTLLADLDGNIFDPLGSGLDDLDNKVVRFVGEPEQRIREDVLRILRFFRFHACYGHGEPESNALEACARLAYLIPQLSRERITGEMSKIIWSGNAPQTLTLMAKNAIMPELFASYNKDSFRNLIELQTECHAPNLIARYLALCGLSPAQFDKSRDFILYTNHQLKEKNAIFHSISHTQEAKDTSNALLQARQCAYKYNKQASIQALLLKSSNREIQPETVKECIRELENWKVPEFPVNGYDLQEIGIKPGKRMGDIMKRAEQWWVEQNFSASRQDCLEYIKAHYC